MQYYTQLDYTDGRGLYKNPDQGDFNSQLKYSKANIRANVDFEVSSTTRVSANLLGILMETNGVPDVNSNDAWWHLYKVPALAFPIRTAGGVWGGSQTFGDYNLLAKTQGRGFMKTHQRQIWANMSLKFYVGASYDNSSNTIETRSKGYQYGWNYYSGGAMQETVMGTVEDKLVFNHWVDSQWRIATFNAGFRYATQLNNGDNLAANANYNMKSEIRDNRSNTWYRANWQLATVRYASRVVSSTATMCHSQVFGRQHGTARTDSSGMEQTSPALGVHSLLSSQPTTSFRRQPTRLTSVPI